MKVSIVHYGGENHYLLGLVTGLKQFDGLVIEVVGSDNSEKLFEWTNILTHKNLRRSIDPARPKIKKITNLILFYFRLSFYFLTSDADIFHFQWETNLFIIDRMIFVPILKLRKKKVIYTAHNADNEGRSEKKTLLNRLTINFFYMNFDAIIAHTKKVKLEIMQKNNIKDDRIFVIPHGINIIPKKKLSKKAALDFLNIGNSKKVLLCFGAIEPYKGIDLMLKALIKLIEIDESYFLIIAGRCLNARYLKELEEIIKENNLGPYLKFVNKFIPDEEISYYLNAADVLVLPYRAIYQSGVLFLAYSFGTPVIATNVGSFSEDIIEGKTGLIAEPNNIHSLANKINEFFNSNLFIDKENVQNFIIKNAEEKYSWNKIGALTYNLYKSVFN